MTNDVAEERKKLHAELKEELFKRQLSNSDNFDKAILTYSSAGLALSLGFLKDFVPITRANASWLLYLSWALFLVAVVVTLFSFISSQIGIAKQLTLNERYYLKMDDTVLSESNFFARCTDWLAYLAGTAFVVAISCSTLFVSINLERAAIMAEHKQLGVPIPGIQEVQQTNLQKGAPVPGIQQAPQQPAQNSGSGSTASSNGTTSNSNSNAGKP